MCVGGQGGECAGSMDPQKPSGKEQRILPRNPSASLAAHGLICLSEAGQV